MTYYCAFLQHVLIAVVYMNLFYAILPCQKYLNFHTFPKEMTMKL